ncbi:MAG: RHS repeat domain-containing protein [Chitinophagaceae bacterium]
MLPNTLTPAESYSYDNLGRYLTSKSATGSGVTKTETYSYNNINDQAASITSSDGLTTTFAYDAFGRVTQQGFTGWKYHSSFIRLGTIRGPLFHKFLAGFQTTANGIKNILT